MAEQEQPRQQTEPAAESPAEAELTDEQLEQAAGGKSGGGEQDILDEY